MQNEDRAPVPESVRVDLERGARAWRPELRDADTDRVRALVWTATVCTADGEQISPARVSATTSVLRSLAPSLDASKIAAIRDELFEQPWEGIEGTLAFVLSALPEPSVRELALGHALAAALVEPLGPEHAADLVFVARGMDVGFDVVLEAAAQALADHPDRARETCLLLVGARCAELVAPDDALALRARWPREWIEGASAGSARAILDVAAGLLASERAPTTDAERDALAQLRAALATLLALGHRLATPDLRLDALHPALAGDVADRAADEAIHAMNARAWGQPLIPGLAAALRDPILRRMTLSLAARAGLLACLAERSVSDLVELAQHFGVELEELRFLVRSALLPSATDASAVAHLEHALVAWWSLHLTFRGGLLTPSATSDSAQQPWHARFLGSEAERAALARGIEALREGKREGAAEPLVSALGLGLAVARVAGALDAWSATVEEVTGRRIDGAHLGWVHETLAQGERSAIEIFARGLVGDASLRRFAYALAFRVGRDGERYDAPEVAGLVADIADALALSPAEGREIAMVTLGGSSPAR